MLRRQSVWASRHDQQGLPTPGRAAYVGRHPGQQRWCGVSRPVCHGPASTRYDLRKLHGLPSPWVDTAQARRRVVHLHGWGISYLDIARAAGIPASTVRAVGHGHQRRAYAYTVGAILAVDHHPRPTQAQALSVGAHRRVQALAAMGWPGRVVAVHLGVSQSRLAVLTARPVMSYRYWRAITEVYDRWGTTPGPSARCQSRARTLGWPTALAWEGVDIDDPRTRADGRVRVVLRVAVATGPCRRWLIGTQLPAEIRHRTSPLRRIGAARSGRPDRRRQVTGADGVLVDEVRGGGVPAIMSLQVPTDGPVEHVMSRRASPPVEAMIRSIAFAESDGDDDLAELFTLLKAMVGSGNVVEAELAVNGCVQGTGPDSGGQKCSDATYDHGVEGVFEAHVAVDRQWCVHGHRGGARVEPSDGQQGAVGLGRGSEFRQAGTHHRVEDDLGSGPVGEFPNGLDDVLVVAGDDGGGAGRVEGVPLRGTAGDGQRDGADLVGDLDRGKSVRPPSKPPGVRPPRRSKQTSRPRSASTMLRLPSGPSRPRSTPARRRRRHQPPRS